MSYSLGSLAITANTAAIFQAPDSGVKGILIGNESGLTVTITMESGNVQKTLYPSMLDWFDVRPGFTGNIKIAPTIILNNVTSFPASSLVFDAIGLNDSENASMYPVHMPRNTNIGNSVTTTGIQTLVNDGNARGTQIIESTALTDGQSSVQVLNDGTVTIRGDVAGVLTTLLQLRPNSNQVINTPGGTLIALEVAGTTIFTVTSSGVGLVTGNISLLTGGLSRIQAIGQTTIAQAGTSVAHSLGVTPDFVLPVHDTGGQNSDVITINFGTMSTTNFTAYTTNAAGSGNVRFLVFKF